MHAPELKEQVASLTHPDTDKLESNCSSCGHGLQYNFCSRCGQMKYRRIDKNYVIQELLNVFSTTGGFFYSIKNLLVNPGKTAKEFIEGKRVMHFRPLYLAFILSGFGALFQYKLIGFADIMISFYEKNGMGSDFMADMVGFMANYHSFIMLASIPFFAFCTKLAFWKWGHNYYEHIVMNAYILSAYILFNMLLIYPLMYVFRDQPEVVVQLAYSAYLLAFILVAWFFKGFYPERTLKSIIGHTFLIMGIMFLSYIGLIICVVIVMLVFKKIGGH